MKSLVVLAVLAAITIQTFEICSASTCNVYMGGKLVIPIYGPVHRYTCCNNCQETNPTCDGKTYQGGSTGSYCGRCGQSTGGGALITSNVQCIRPRQVVSRFLVTARTKSVKSEVWPLFVVRMRSQILRP